MRWVLPVAIHISLFPGPVNPGHHQTHSNPLGYWQPAEEDGRLAQIPFVSRRYPDLEWTLISIATRQPLAFSERDRADEQLGQGPRGRHYGFRHLAQAQGWSRLSGPRLCYPAVVGLTCLDTIWGCSRWNFQPGAALFSQLELFLGTWYDTKRHNRLSTED